MAFSVPSFNLNVDIYDGPWLTKALRLSVLGNLAFGRRIQQFTQTFFDPQDGVSTFQELLLLPKLTDVRSRLLVPDTDILEIPSGSGRWYGCEAVEDVAKGFANEYRVALVVPVSALIDNVRYAGLLWPVPMP